MRTLMVANMNEFVEVELTEAGKEIYFHQYDYLNKHYGKEIIKPHYPKLEENGRFRTQLWMLFKTFGETMSMTMESPFKDNKIYFEVNK